MVQPDAFNRFAPPPRSFAFDHSNNRSVVVLGLHMRKCAGTAVRRMFADTGLLFCLFHPHISAPCRQLLLAEMQEKLAEKATVASPATPCTTRPEPEGVTTNASS